MMSLLLLEDLIKLIFCISPCWKTRVHPEMFFLPAPPPPPTQEKKENKGCDHEKNEHGNAVLAFVLLFLEFAMIWSKQIAHILYYLLVLTRHTIPYIISE